MQPVLDDGPVDAWEFERDVDPRLATVCALDRVEPPDMRVLVTASTSDTVTVDVLVGGLLDPASLLYVEHRGLFKVVRVEGSLSGRRARLALRAFPSRS